MPRPVRAALAALAVALSAAGCVSMPSNGPVVSYPITQGPDTQNQNYVQVEPQPPGKNWSPKQIVEGFLTASASFGTYGQVAEEYLTANGRANWKPSWSANVYKTGPNVKDPVYSGGSAKSKAKKVATVSIGGTVEASLQTFGSYSVSSASGSTITPFTLVLQKDGQWRIDSAPDKLLLTSDSFENDYELRQLYFFNPASKYLVPDPVYVPLNANLSALVNGLVHDLIAPPGDWLSAGPTHTAIPGGTKIDSVGLNGVTAVVNLGGKAIAKAAAASSGAPGTAVLQRVSAQLLWTLSGAAQSGASADAVQSVQLEVNGTQWVPTTSQGNPVQRPSASSFRPATGASSGFYYIDKSGWLIRQDATTGKPAKIRRLGTRYSQLAVSPSGKYLAVLSARGGHLSTGPINGPLVDRGTGYTTMSWDASTQLWASKGNSIVMLRGDANLRQPQGQPVSVDVIGQKGNNNMPGPWTSLRVAPDGVRVAMVLDYGTVYFGAIDVQQGSRPGQVSIQIALSQVEDPTSGAIEFTGLTWYGPDNVITLSSPGSAVTEYPVSGGTATSIPADPDMQAITASSGHPLIGALSKGQLVADASLTGAWLQIDSGTAPAYPG